MRRSTLGGFDSLQLIWSVRFRPTVTNKKIGLKMLTTEQHAARKAGIGGSDVAAILGINPYRTAMQVWLEKTGRMEPEDISNKPAVYWGNVLEPVIADEYAKRTGLELEIVPETLKHSKFPWLLGHIDRRIIGLSKFLECKTAGFYAAKDWGDTGTDFVPEPYIMQIQHYLAITGYEEADLAVLIAGSDFRIYNIKRDEGLISMMIEELNNFWHNHVLADMPPQSTSRLDVAQLHPRDNGDLAEAPTETVAAINEYKLLKAKISDLETIKNRWEHEITKTIGPASGIKIADQVLATWKANKNGSRVLRLYGE